MHNKQGIFAIRNNYITWEISHISNINTRCFFFTSKYTILLGKRCLFNISTLIYLNSYWLERRNKLHHVKHSDFCFACSLLEVQSSVLSSLVTTFHPNHHLCKKKINIANLSNLDPRFFYCDYIRHENTRHNTTTRHKK